MYKYFEEVMRNKKLKNLLKLWQSNDLITQLQSEKILEFMKERQKEMLFRGLKWLMIIGTFWLVFGVVATFVMLCENDFFLKLLNSLGEIIGYIGGVIWLLLSPIHDYIIHPICGFIEKCFGEERQFFYFGLYSLLVSLILSFFSSKKSSNKNIDDLNLSDEQKNVLKTNWTLDIASNIFLAATFCLFNMLLLPDGDMYGDDKIVPIWNILGALTFILMAYKFKKNLHLVFGIYFVALSVGIFSGYGFACYWIGVSRPIIQILVGVILLLIAYITQLKSVLKEKEDDNDSTYIREKFAGTYNWAGLLLIFIALWITSIWGFDLNFGKVDSTAIELWLANILFIASAVGAMFYGIKSEQKIFFNYGLVFLIIETYTIFCSWLWESMPTGIASLTLGSLLIGTAKLLQRVYLKKTLATPDKTNEVDNT